MSRKQARSLFGTPPSVISGAQFSAICQQQQQQQKHYYDKVTLSKGKTKHSLGEIEGTHGRPTRLLSTQLIHRSKTSCQRVRLDMTRQGNPTIPRLTQKKFLELEEVDHLINQNPNYKT